MAFRTFYTEKAYEPPDYSFIQSTLDAIQKTAHANQLKLRASKIANEKRKKAIIDMQFGDGSLKYQPTLIREGQKVVNGMLDLNRKGLLGTGTEEEAELLHKQDELTQMAAQSKLDEEIFNKTKDILAQNKTQHGNEYRSDIAKVDVTDYYYSNKAGAVDRDEIDAVVDPFVNQGLVNIANTVLNFGKQYQSIFAQSQKNITESGIETGDITNVNKSERQQSGVFMVTNAKGDLEVGVSENVIALYLSSKPLANSFFDIEIKNENRGDAKIIAAGAKSGDAKYSQFFGMDADQVEEVLNAEVNLDGDIYLNPLRSGYTNEVRKRIKARKILESVNKSKYVKSDFYKKSEDEISARDEKQIEEEKEVNRVKESIFRIQQLQPKWVAMLEENDKILSATIEEGKIRIKFHNNNFDDVVLDPSRKDKTGDFAKIFKYLPHSLKTMQVLEKYADYEPSKEEAEKIETERTQAKTLKKAQQSMVARWQKGSSDFDKGDTPLEDLVGLTYTDGQEIAKAEYIKRGGGKKLARRIKLTLSDGTTREINIQEGEAFNELMRIAEGDREAKEDIGII